MEATEGTPARRAGRTGSAAREQIQSLAARVYERTVRELPPGSAARIDWLRPSLRQSWGGPLNGQRERQGILRSLLRDIPFGAIVETGAFRGNTTEFFAMVSGLPTRTIESNERYATYTRRRCADYPNVEVVVGDSRAFLGDLPIGTEHDLVLYYLDAHWNADLPLREELTIIARRERPTVIMIDDFQVDDDPDYRYDDYGPGAALTAEILEGLEVASWPRFYPSARSCDETGARRGCIVIVHPTLGERVAQVAGLRPAGQS